ncbi:MAG: hypothetical protein Q8N90_02540 [bacterium]|nr:hypothetical protein [bacterium]
MKKRVRIGKTMEQIMVLMQGGLALSLSRRPDAHFKILKNIGKELYKINQKHLRQAIKNLYTSQLITCKEDENGNVTLILNDKGKKRALQYNLDAIQIKKPAQWDGLWRLVIFDIPENKKQTRNALSFKLKQMNFYPMQKSVFIHPYDCKNEIDFLIELFDLRPFVRFLIVQKTDIDLKLKNYFDLK